MTTSSPKGNWLSPLLREVARHIVTSGVPAPSRLAEKKMIMESKDDHGLYAVRRNRSFWCSKAA